MPEVRQLELGAERPVRLGRSSHTFVPMWSPLERYDHAGLKNLTLLPIGKLR